MTWRVNFVRSKSAQKQLARTSLTRYGSFSVSIFYVLRTNEENLSCRSFKLIRSFNFLQNAAPSNSVHLTSWFSCAAVSNASQLTVKVCENDGNV